jgi:DNA-binding MarR family transcriptional regulator
MAKMVARVLKSEIAEVMNENSITDSDITVIFKNRGVKETELFVKVFQKTLEYYVNSLTGSGMKLMMYFISTMQYGNFVEVDQKDLMSKLKMGRTALNKSMTELKELGVLNVYPDLNDKRRNTYMVNHYAAWKGNPGDRLKSIKKNKETFPNPNQLPIPFSENK